MNSSTKFGVFSDLHVEIMHDSIDRLKHFLVECKNQNVDFIIQLGDFIFPTGKSDCRCKPSNRTFNVEGSLGLPPPIDQECILKLFHDIFCPSYHVLGNHDLDMSSKQELMDFIGLTRSYYSFDSGNYHFIVLDSNFIFENGLFIPYSYGNYLDYYTENPLQVAYLSSDQLDWLVKDLDSTVFPTILFSHHSLIDKKSGVKNYSELEKILNMFPGKVILSLNGHNHKDLISRKNEIWYLTLNSMSCYGLGKSYEFIRYSAEIDDQFPSLKYTVPYRDPLFAIISINHGEIEIIGRQSEFVGPSPYDLGFPFSAGDSPITPSIRSYNLCY